MKTYRYANTHKSSTHSTTTGRLVLRCNMTAKIAGLPRSARWRSQSIFVPVLDGSCSLHSGARCPIIGLYIGNRWTSHLCNRVYLHIHIYKHTGVDMCIYTYMSQVPAVAMICPVVRFRPHPYKYIHKHLGLLCYLQTPPPSTPPLASLPMSAVAGQFRAPRA